jgi:hypothetical protein
MNKDILLDQHLSAQRTDINLESPNCAGDMALSGFVIDKLYDDFVFADYIDIDNGFITDEKSGLVRAVSDTNKTWRKALVIKVGPACRQTKPGDIVIFPNDKGLPCGEVEYLRPMTTAEAVERNEDPVSNWDKEWKQTYIKETAKHGIFLGEHRIFATVKRDESGIA